MLNMLPKRLRWFSWHSHTQYPSILWLKMKFYCTEKLEKKSLTSPPLAHRLKHCFVLLTVLCVTWLLLHFEGAAAAVAATAYLSTQHCCVNEDAHTNTYTHTYTHQALLAGYGFDLFSNFLLLFFFFFLIFFRCKIFQYFFLLQKSNNTLKCLPALSPLL